jgi:hypothetical protein
VQTGDEPSGNFPTSRQTVCFLNRRMVPAVGDWSLLTKAINIKYGFVFRKSTVILSVQ